MDKRPPIRSTPARAKAVIHLKRTLTLVALLTCFTALAGCSGCSHGAAVPVVLGNSAADGACGLSDDSLAHIPPDFNDFMPPAKGDSHADPQYGCPVVRLTDGRAQFKLAVHHRYSTISALNQDDSDVMLITEWGQGTIVDTAGNIVVGPRNFPAINAGNVPWAKHPAAAFYYTNKNALYRGSIFGQGVKSTALHIFTGYPSVTIPDQEDLSNDGDHLWIVGGTQAFHYTISIDTVGAGLSVKIPLEN